MAGPGSVGIDGDSQSFFIVSGKCIDCIAPLLLYACLHINSHLLVHKLNFFSH